MSDSLRTDGLKFDQYKLQLETQQERQLKDLREKHRVETEKMIDHYGAVKRDLEKAYELDLSTTRDEYEHRLAEARKSNGQRIEEEKTNGEAEADRVRARYQEQIARYKENSEKSIEETRRQADEAVNNIRIRSKERSRA